MSLLDQIASGGKTSGLDIARAGTQGQADAATMADSALARKVKQSEYDEYLEGRQARRVKREAGVSSDKNTMWSNEKLQFWDSANMMLGETATQEDYTSVLQRMSPAMQKHIQPTGNWEVDKPKIRKALDTFKDSTAHIRDLEKINVKAATGGSGVKKLHSPKPPQFIKDPASIRMIISQDVDLNNMATAFWGTDSDEQHMDYISNNTMIRANAITNDSYQNATIMSSAGKAWEVVQSQEAVKQALEIEKALLVDDTADGIEYLKPEEAITQKNNWLTQYTPTLVQNNPSFRGLHPTILNNRMNKIYEDYMVSAYQQKKIGKLEASVYGK